MRKTLNAYTRESVKSPKLFRMYDPKTKKIIISQDVVVDEIKKWDWKLGETNSLDLIYE